MEVRMKHSDGFLKIEGYQDLYYQVWQPEKDIHGVILLIHGLGEHGGRYGSHFAEFYTAAGLAVIAPDLPGHGKTTGKRGYIPDNNLFLDIIDQFLQKSRDLYPNKPLFIYGHSLGGLLTLWHALDRHPAINGLIATSPGLRTKNPVPVVKKTLAKVMNNLMPSFTMDNGLDVNQLSRDRSVVEAYVADPLVHKLISAKMGMLFLVNGDWVLEHAAENRVKILLMIGSDEGIVNKAAVDQFSKNAPLVDYKVWPGLFHEIHNEPQKQQVFNHTLNWIKAHFKVNSPV